MRKPPTLETLYGESRPATPRPQPRRFWSRAIVFAACLLLANGLFGERGLVETIRAQRAFSNAAHELARMRRDNAALRETARRLRHDLPTIELVAREELGLIRPGEILVTIRDLKPSAQ